MFDPIIVSHGENVYVIKYTESEPRDFGQIMHHCSIKQVAGNPPISREYGIHVCGAGSPDPSKLIWTALGYVGQLLADHNNDRKEAVK